MRSITLEVPDDIADELDAASETDRQLFTQQFVALVKRKTQPRDLSTVLDEIVEWQVNHSVEASEYEALFKELCDES